MGHSGCINTTLWLDCGWRILSAAPTLLHSLNNYDGIGFGGFAIVSPSSECLTQLLTSGDNVLVNFFDAIFFF
jgi:hypothetical protein